MEQNSNTRLLPYQGLRNFQQFRNVAYCTIAVSRFAGCALLALQFIDHASPAATIATIGLLGLTGYTSAMLQDRKSTLETMCRITVPVLTEMSESHRSSVTTRRILVTTPPDDSTEM